MLKAIVSYSKKIPVPDSEFSSQGFSLSLETENLEQDPVAIQARLHQTFQLVKNQVDHELANGNGNGHAKPPQAQAPAAGNQAPARTTEKASNKQIKFITDLATQRGLSLSDINTDVTKRFGVAGLYDLKVPMKTRSWISSGRPTRCGEPCRLMK
jgi:hypothetical protein